MLFKKRSCLCTHIRALICKLLLKRRYLTWSADWFLTLVQTWRRLMCDAYLGNFAALASPAISRLYQLMRSWQLSRHHVVPTRINDKRFGIRDYHLRGRSYTKVGNNWRVRAHRSLASRTEPREVLLTSRYRQKQWRLLHVQGEALLG